MGRIASERAYSPPPWKRAHPYHAQTAHESDADSDSDSDPDSGSDPGDSSAGSDNNDSRPEQADEDDPEPEPGSGSTSAGLPYPYPLLTTEDGIRIMRLLPAADDDDPICIELREVSLSSPPAYNAISYAWGLPVNKRGILCDSQTIMIPINLHRALRQLRHPLYPRDFWADAICIDQASSADKSSQVHRMSSIFAQAAQVTVWLGRDTQFSAQSIFPVMREMAQRDFHPDIIPIEVDPFWRHLARLFRRPWFRRLWCLQEIVLAAAAEVRWGEEAAAWYTVAETARWIRSCPAQLLPPGAMAGVNNAHVMFAVARDIRAGKLVSFLELLGLVWQFRSSDHRDVIYALLGLPTTDADVGKGEVFVRPDYASDYCDVYRECAMKVIRQTQSLRLLSHVQLNEDDMQEPRQNLPSWVPRLHNYTHPMLLPSESLSSFNAAAFLPSSQPRVEGRSLIVRGIRLSKVQECIEAWNDDDRPPPQLVEHCKSWLDDGSGKYADSGLTRDEMSSMILTAGKSWGGRLVDDVQQHARDMADHEHVRAASDDKTDDVDETVGEERGSGDGYRFYLAQRDACKGRALLLTQNGHVGLGPRLMQDGDILCLLSNCAMPMILRPLNDDDEAFEVVGEAYIYGIMFGEASVGYQDVDEELKEFALS
ncbi:heterokaryon incompatibility protein-domain-containing protein [Astrocystis sublimbata]|nr:heterokaryon incompatibility protein-domain-containing protein [Astrocystis sublimbata]